MTTRLWPSLSRWVLVASALSLSLGLTGSADADTLVLLSLQCRRTEDSGEDECRLRVQRFGLDTCYRQDMRSGEIWTINQRLSIGVPTRTPVRVTLIDEDWPDADDSLGSVLIGAAPLGTLQEAVFNRDGAHYVLRYRVDRDPIRVPAPGGFRP